MRRTIFGLGPRSAGFAFVVALVAVAGVVQALFPGSPAGDRAATTATAGRSEKAEQLLRCGKELEARGQKSSAARFYR